MRRVTEERICDRCEEKMYKDTGRWPGSVVSMFYVVVEPSLMPHDYDLCVKCTAMLEKWMKGAT